MPIERIKDLYKATQASISLEAAIVMPVVISVCLFFFNLYQLVLIDDELRNGMSKVSHEVASFYYPVDLAYTSFSETGTGQTVNDWLQSFDGWGAQIPLWQALNKRTDAQARSLVVKPYLLANMSKRHVKDSQLKIEKVSLPSLQDRGSSLFGLEVSYEHPLLIPFLKRTIKLKKAAYERVWIGDQAPAMITHSSELVIQSIVPSRIRRGSKAVITAKTLPGALTSIQIAYKSGNSIARGLVGKHADQTGIVSWTWHVGGNTTEGMWQATVTSGGLRATRMFEVYRK